MTRHGLLRVALGMLLLVLAAGAVFLARGTADAAAAFREQQAEWQRGLVPAPAASPGPAQRAGEAMLGIGARSDVLRAYRDYRAGLANVIPGTTYPQTRARFEAIKTLERLRASLASDEDRSSADVVLGVILTDAASSAGPQREAQLEERPRRVRARGARGPGERHCEARPRGAAAGGGAADEEPARPRARPTDGVRSNENPRNPTAPARAEGDGVLSRCRRSQSSSS